MAYNTENILAFAPGQMFGHLEGGGMIIDRNSGDYIPADQILRDPLRIEQLDFFKEDHLGCMKFGLVDSGQEDDGDGADEGEGDGDDAIVDVGPLEDFSDLQAADSDLFTDDAEELRKLIAEQAADMLTFTTSTKGRHRNFGNDKLDSGRLYRFPSAGRRGKQIYKDRTLRENGSGKTRPKYMS